MKSPSAWKKEDGLNDFAPGIYNCDCHRLHVIGPNDHQGL